MDYLKIANSGWMWFAVAVPMAVLACQVYLLLTRSLKDGKRMGVNSEQIKSAVIASASASIGPSVSILAGMVSLMVMMGAPIAWMRLSYIGAVMFEMTSADVVASLNRWLECFSTARKMVGEATFVAVDDYTVTISLENSAIMLLDMLAGAAQAAAEHEPTGDSRAVDAPSVLLGQIPVRTQRVLCPGVRRRVSRTDTAGQRVH